ncbi:hypothetical protein V8J38_11135 [Brevundimonas olei]|uniref:Uncharacterized protein n=1 Tax=Brevundimonas olei TaxID=657642 RepID=A0ABZ2I850_9CAUL
MASEAASIGSTVLSAGSSIMGGRARSRELKGEAVMLEAQAKGVDIQAKQASERRREDLRAALSAYTAQRAARGLSLDTPSGIAIENELRRQAVRDESVERLGYTNQAGALRMSAAAKRRGGSLANSMGWLNAASTIMSNASDLASAGRR